MLHNIVIVLQGILYDNVVCSLTIGDSYLHCTGVTVGLCNVVSDASTLTPSEMPGLVWMSGIEARIHKDRPLTECIISALDSLKGKFSVTASICVCVVCSRCTLIDACILIQKTTIRSSTETSNSS